MIYIIVGTKAQFIKMAPVMVALERRKAAYCVIDLSQHGGLGREMLASFKVKPEIVTPFPRDRPVDSVLGGLAWVVKILSISIFRPNIVRKYIFRGGLGIAAVHGDTMSTFIGLALARRNKIPVSLVEAGLRSGKVLSPFPEELIRRLVERWCSVLFAPGSEEFQYLKMRSLGKRIVNTGYNTGRDALMLMVGERRGADEESLPIVTVHRLETLTRKKRLKKVIDTVISVAACAGKVKFVMHPPTEKALVRYGLLERVKTSPYIECEGLKQYEVFAGYLVKAPFIMTDGGSIQEEASYLNKPCVILRDRTERCHGIGVTAKLTTWDADKDWAFIKNVLRDSFNDNDSSNEMRASEIIVEELLNNLH